jgi:hypothetical protein
VEGKAHAGGVAAWQGKAAAKQNKVVVVVIQRKSHCQRGFEHYCGKARCFAPLSLHYCCYNPWSCSSHGLRAAGNQIHKTTLRSISYTIFIYNTKLP